MSLVTDTSSTNAYSHQLQPLSPGQSGSGANSYMGPPPGVDHHQRSTGSLLQSVKSSSQSQSQSQSQAFPSSSPVHKQANEVPGPSSHQTGARAQQSSQPHAPYDASSRERDKEREVMQAVQRLQQQHQQQQRSHIGNVGAMALTSSSLNGLSLNSSLRGFPPSRDNSINQGSTSLRASSNGAQAGHNQPSQPYASSNGALSVQGHLQSQGGGAGAHQQSSSQAAALRLRTSAVGGAAAGNGHMGTSRNGYDRPSQAPASKELETSGSSQHGHAHGHTNSHALKPQSFTQGQSQLRSDRERDRSNYSPQPAAGFHPHLHPHGHAAAHRDNHGHGHSHSHNLQSSSSHNTAGMPQGITGVGLRYGPAPGTSSSTHSSGNGGSSSFSKAGHTMGAGGIGSMGVKSVSLNSTGTFGARRMY